MMLEQLDIHRQKILPLSKPHMLYKINSTWITGLNVKLNFINLTNQKKFLQSLGKKLRKSSGYRTSQNS